MRTTLAIDDDIFAYARSHAQREHISIIGNYRYVKDIGMGKYRHINPRHPLICCPGMVEYKLEGLIDFVSFFFG